MTVHKSLFFGAIYVRFLRKAGRPLSQNIGQDWTNNK